mgnify:CR=1 FL=1
MSLHSARHPHKRVYVLASDVVFMKALRNTFLFVIEVAPLQPGLCSELGNTRNWALFRVHRSRRGNTLAQCRDPLPRRL